MHAHIFVCNACCHLFNFLVIMPKVNYSLVVTVKVLKLQNMYICIFIHLENKKPKKQQVLKLHKYATS